MSDPGTIGGIVAVAACVCIAAILILEHFNLRK